MCEYMENCTICLKVTKSPFKLCNTCDHYYHIKCIFDYLSKYSKSKCPTCRKPLTEIQVSKLCHSTINSILCEVLNEQKANMESERY